MKRKVSSILGAHLYVVDRNLPVSALNSSATEKCTGAAHEHLRKLLACFSKITQHGKKIEHTTATRVVSTAKIKAVFHSCVSPPLAKNYDNKIIFLLSFAAGETCAVPPVAENF